MFLSPRVNDINIPKLGFKKSQTKRLAQSTQELPRMNLFIDILSKFMRKRRKNMMRIFLVNLYKEAYPQLEDSKLNLARGIASDQNSSNLLSDRNSNKSTGRFHKDGMTFAFVNTCWIRIYSQNFNFYFGFGFNQLVL